MEAGRIARPLTEDAFDVQVGLETTMTADDILNGLLRVSVKVALVRLLNLL